MDVDIGPALSETASPGISREALDRLDERVTRAHERIERGRREEAFGYRSLSLPVETDPERLRRATASLAARDPEHLLLVGIGGSALGAATLADALTTPEDGDPETHVLDNVDPEHARRVLSAVDPAETVVVAVSRSGTTTETLANFLAVRDRFERADVDWTERTLVVTGEEGPLRRLADRHDLASLPTPPGVPGRFGVLSAVGLAPAALAGVDVEAVLSGAGEVDLEGSLYDCPAYAYGATAVALSARGARVNALVPYAERLETFGEWAAQLWAESLGKDGLGQVPARALGATDQHSQLQLYRDGPRNLTVTTVAPRERPALRLPGGEDTDGGTSDRPAVPEELSHLAGEDLGRVIDAEHRATVTSLSRAGRPSVRVETERVDARSLGRLLYGFEAACVLAGELLSVNAFDQPAVEWGKRAARGLLGEETAESRAVGDLPELRVEE
ncbi:glucose-6-phosphate isomerase [Halobacteriales archaeon SW_5_70_135]|nr:MAG: glucose-6-phosphate isomerase [Halobacteriales archaeon SW_5_70_135]